jgi:DNA polymerase III epsilon subunit family exonuclease
VIAWSKSAASNCWAARLTGQRFHAYLNPGRPVADSERIHGLSDDFLADKPKFDEVAAEFIEFIRGAELVIHNAAFDVGFLNNELGMLNTGGIAQICSAVIDTLRMAREMRPGKKNNLNALCSEFGVDNSGRQLHGALLDAELLAEVYLAMTRGQNSLWQCVPWRWHAMAGIGSAMIVIYGLILLRWYPRLKAAVAAQDWPAGGAAMNVIRPLVLVNLILGMVTVVIAMIGG